MANEIIMVQNSRPLLRMTGVKKSFGQTHALKGVSFDVFPGEVHGLVGENGAGKSTLMKILSGAHIADKGEMELLGKPYRPAGPMDARLKGIAMIYQELNLLPHLTIEENVMFGREKSRFGIVDQAAHYERVHKALEFLGRNDMQPGAVVGNLSVGAQQLVEVARALAFDARVIVFDEPTSSLTSKDAERLFTVIRRLKKQQVGIVYISHFLEEVTAIADRFTVLRDGESVGSGKVAGTSIEQIIELMVGRKVKDLYPQIPHEQGKILLSAQHLSGIKFPEEATFELKAGEILGIAGLVGGGRTELLRAVFGLDPIRSGELTAGTINLRNLTPRGRIKAGLGFLSEDRKEEGLAINLSIADNTTLSHFKPLSKHGWINLSLQKQTVRKWIEDLSIKTSGPDQKVESLSGGNQQKVAIARLLHQEADILLFDEPTRGIDVASKAQIYRLVGNLAAKKKGIIFVSSYLPELFGVCDSLAVMSRGHLSEIKPRSEWTEESVMAFATGGN